MLFRSIITAILLTASLPVVARDTVTVQQSPNTRQVTKICKQLTETTEAIETSLLKVKDRKSADDAAPHMRQLQHKARTLLQQLEEAPGDLMNNREITRTMVTITHIAQRYNPIITHLQAENAYGSEPLLAVLQVLGSDDPYGETADREQDTHTRREELDASIDRILSDVLYELRKTSDNYSARNAAAMLRPALIELIACTDELANLPPTSTDEPHLASIENNEKRSALKNKVAEEITRLQQAAYYDDPDLPIMLEQYSNLLK